MADPLDGVWRKLDRAKCHVDDLRCEVMEATNGDPTTIGLGHRYDDDTECVVVYAERVPEIRESYGILVGDAMHNFRCVLDHLWWQLAKSHLRREPTSDEAKNIQFPILSDRKYRTDDAAWRAHRFLSHVSDEVAAETKTMQPFSYPVGGPIHMAHPLEVLAELSNVDKHQAIHIAVLVPHKVSVGRPRPVRDCELRPIYGPDGEPMPEFTIARRELRKPMRVDDPVVYVPVVKTGPHPDVELKAKLTGSIALQTEVGPNALNPMLEYLDVLSEDLPAVVRRLEPFL